MSELEAAFSVDAQEAINARFRERAAQLETTEALQVRGACGTRENGSACCQPHHTPSQLASLESDLTALDNLAAAAASELAGLRAAVGPASPLSPVDIAQLAPRLLDRARSLFVAWAAYHASVVVDSPGTKV